DCWVDPYAVAKLNPSQNPLAISNGNDWINDPPCQPFSFPKASPGVVGVCSFGERLVASRVIVFTDGRQFGQAIAERNRNTRPTPTSASWLCSIGRILRATPDGLRLAMAWMDWSKQDGP